MDGEPTSQTRLIWIALTVVVVALAAWFGVVITQQQLDTQAEVQDDETPD